MKSQSGTNLKPRPTRRNNSLVLVVRPYSGGKYGPGKQLRIVPELGNELDALLERLAQRDRDIRLAS